MSAIKPVPVCGGRAPLLDRGSEVSTNRFALSVTPQAIFIAHDVKEILIHYESGTQLYTMKGTIPGRKWFLTATANTDAGGGIVLVHSTAHGFTLGDTITLTGCATAGGTVLVPDGDYVLQAGTDADHLGVLATYVAGTPVTTGYAVGYRNAVITDLGTSYDIVLPVVKTAGETIVTLTHASTGTVSTIEWR